MKRLAKFGMCSGCTEMKNLQAHHILPQRDYNPDVRSPFCFLCQECHSELHKDWIDILGYPPREVLISATRDFLMDKRKAVMEKYNYRF